MATVAQPSALRSWFWATRPFSLTASIVPILVGTALAASSDALDWDLDWALFALALTGSIAIQIGTNLTDEYADHRRHGSTGKFLAPHKVLQRGELSERAVLLGLAVSFGCGVAAGLYIAAQVSWLIVAVGVVSMAVAYLYSAGPYPIGDRALGEPTVFLFMGVLMVMAAYFVQTKEVTLESFGASLPVAFLVTAILHCNNLRDAEEDQASGKRTLARLLGPGRSRWAYGALLASAYLSIGGMVAGGVLSLWALVALVTLPMAAIAASLLQRAAERRDLHRVMVRTASLHWYCGIALAAGLAVG